MRPRAWCILMILFLCALSASAQDFRKVTWGMSVDDVIAAESALTFSEMDNGSTATLTSRVDVMGHTGTLNYIFEDSKLIIAQYRFDDDDTMGTFREIRGFLKQRYGNAADSGDTYSRWRTPRTYVRLSYKDNVCRVDYADQTWVAAAGDAQKAEYDSLF